MYFKAIIILNLQTFNVLALMFLIMYECNSLSWEQLLMQTFLSFLVFSFHKELPCLEELNATTKNGEICIHYMFKVSESSPFTEIKWTKNNSELKVPSDKYRNGEIEDNFITIVRPSEGDKGLYTCTILNAVGPVSKSIRLGKTS